VTTAAFGVAGVTATAYKTLVAFLVALAVLFAAGTTGFGHVAGLVAEGDPQCPPYISTTAF
jgi:hypothetical protein